MQKNKFIHPLAKLETGTDAPPKNEFIQTDDIFDLEEIAIALLMERKQNQDYNFYYQLSLIGFYLSLILFIWLVIN